MPILTVNVTSISINEKYRKEACKGPEKKPSISKIDLDIFSLEILLKINQAHSKLKWFRNKRYFEITHYKTVGVA